MTYLMFNPRSKNGNAQLQLEKLRNLLKGEQVKQIKVTEIKDYRKFFNEIDDDDTIYLLGGDGTLNHFINDTDGIDIKNRIFYCPGGTGNDFFKDVEDDKDNNGLVELNKYIEKLPEVEINGKKMRFINGIGFGIDGYCCEEGDRLQAQSDKPVNYTSIAIKGLLFKFKPANAVVTVDSVKKEYKKVWLAPTMNGRLYGGGMMVAPAQDRLNPERTLTNVVMHGSGKLKTLMVFPSIFKGEHISHKEMVSVNTGKEITVTFDRPCALQIDGETVKNVTSYTARSCNV